MVIDRTTSFGENIKITESHPIFDNFNICKQCWERLHISNISTGIITSSPFATNCTKNSSISLSPTTSLVVPLFRDATNPLATWSLDGQQQQNLFNENLDISFIFPSQSDLPIKLTFVPWKEYSINTTDEFSRTIRWDNTNAINQFLDSLIKSQTYATSANYLWITNATNQSWQILSFCLDSNGTPLPTQFTKIHWIGRSHNSYSTIRAIRRRVLPDWLLNTVINAE